MGRQGDRQGELMVMWSEMPRSPGHVFYDRLQEVLVGAGFDGFVEESLPSVLRQDHGRALGAAGSVLPHAHGRVLRGDRQRARDRVALLEPFSLREFLRLEATDRVPDHSWLSKTRSRLPHEVHEACLRLGSGLDRRTRAGAGANGSAWMLRPWRPNAALRAIVRRDTSKGYRAMLTRMAQESGIETPTAEDLIRLDRQRTGKRLSNEEWVSRTDPEARIARMKDGTTHLAYKPEHAVDLDTGAVVAAEVHAADEGDTTTITGTLDAARRNLTSVGAPPSSDDPPGAAQSCTPKPHLARAHRRAAPRLGSAAPRFAPPPSSFLGWRENEIRMARPS